jgi:hypothetical protein
LVLEVSIANETTSAPMSAVETSSSTQVPEPTRPYEPSELMGRAGAFDQVIVDSLQSDETR